MQEIGGRKFAAFLVLTVVLVLFVFSGHLKDEAKILEAFVKLLALYAGANVVQKAVEAVPVAVEKWKGGAPPA